MLMNNDRPKQVVTKHKVCDYHKKHPGKLWPGCTCFTVYFQEVIERESKDSADLCICEKPNFRLDFYRDKIVCIKCGKNSC